MNPRPVRGRYRQLTRCLSLATCIHRDPQMSVARLYLLSAMHHVSTRTIRRDLCALAEVGVRCSWTTVDMDIPGDRTR